jgi:hypothetical protein
MAEFISSFPITIINSSFCMVRYKPNVYHFKFFISSDEFTVGYLTRKIFFNGKTSCVDWFI